MESGADKEASELATDDLGQEMTGRKAPFLHRNRHCTIKNRRRKSFFIPLPSSYRELTQTTFNSISHLSWNVLPMLRFRRESAFALYAPMLRLLRLSGKLPPEVCDIRVVSPASFMLRETRIVVAPLKPHPPLFALSCVCRTVHRATFRV